MTTAEEAAEQVRAFLVERAKNNQLDPEDITGIGTSDGVLFLTTTALEALVQSVLPDVDIPRPGRRQPLR